MENLRQSRSNLATPTMKPVNRGYLAALECVRHLGAVSTLFPSAARGFRCPGHRTPRRVVLPVRARLDRNPRRDACAPGDTRRSKRCLATGRLGNPDIRQLAHLCVGGDARARHRNQSGLFHRAAGQRGARSGSSFREAQPGAMGGGRAGGGRRRRSHLHDRKSSVDRADVGILVRNLWPDPQSRESRIVARTRNRNIAARSLRGRVFAVVRAGGCRCARPCGTHGRCAADRQRAGHRHRLCSLFAYGTRLLPYSTVGVLQYITPTLQFACGVFVLHEPFEVARAVGFTIIWAALLIYAGEGLRLSHRQRASA